MLIGGGCFCVADVDNDGVCDSIDNCVNIANSDQLDTDADGVGDVCDEDIYGCPDSGACNYNPDATVDNGSCLYYDCAFECGGSAEYDECDVCNGNGTNCLELGDLNSDGLINIQDIILVVELILNDNYEVLGDVNEDGQLNIQDIIVLLNTILGEDNDTDIDGDGVADDEDSDPYNPYECSDNDGDTCDDCTSGNYDPQNDGYDPDGDGQCEDGNCILYIILAENELEGIFFDIYNNEDFAYCLDNLDDDPTCIGDLLELDNVIYLYDTALIMCPTNPSANFGSAIVNLMSIVTDPELNELLNRWFEFFNSEDESLGRLSGFNMGIPSRQSAYEGFNASNIYNIFSKLLVNPTNVLGRSSEDAPYLSELQELLESEFIPRINTSISKIEQVIDEDYNFIITGEMQGDIYQDDIHMDDTEFYLMKAYMHFFSALFHVIVTYDISEIAIDISDYTVLNHDHPFLTIRPGAYVNMPLAYQNLNHLYSSLESSFDFLMSETDWQENDYIQNDLSDANYNEIIDNLDQIEEILNGDYIHSVDECIDWECNFEYDQYWQDFDCDCIGESVEITNTINIGNFMNNPPQNLKEYIPDYYISNDECTSDNENETFFSIEGGICIENCPVSFSIIFDSDIYIQSDSTYGYVRTRNIKSVSINTINGNNYTIDRPDDWASIPSQVLISDQIEKYLSDNNQYPPEFNIQTRDSEYLQTNWRLIEYIGDGGSNVWDNQYSFYALLGDDHYFHARIYADSWDMSTENMTSEGGEFGVPSGSNGNYISNLHIDGAFVGVHIYGYADLTIPEGDPFPCPQLTWAASTYEQWVSEWNGDGMTIDINANNGINSLSFAFDGDPSYWSEYGYYARKFSSITINSAFGETTIARPDNWDDMRSNDYEFTGQDESLPDWIDRYQLRNPMSWHLVSMGSGDVFYIFASDENSEIYSLLYSDNYWGMNSDNSFSDHWIDFTNNGSFILSFDGSAYAQAQQPIDITINGLYPEMTLEDVLLLYQNLFNIDGNNWKQTIGGD